MEAGSHSGPPPHAQALPSGQIAVDSTVEHGSFQEFSPERPGTEVLLPALLSPYPSELAAGEDVHFTQSPDGMGKSSEDVGFIQRERSASASQLDEEPVWSSPLVGKVC